MKNFFRKLFGKPILIEGNASLYRMMALVGSIAVLIQSIIWTILCLISLTYYGMGGVHSGKNDHLLSAYAYMFSSAYYQSNPLIDLDLKLKLPKGPIGPNNNETANNTMLFTMPIMLRPDTCASVSATGLFVLTIIYLAGSVVVCISSIILLLAVKSWSDAKYIRNAVTFWLVAVLLMSAVEFACGMIFFADFLICSNLEQHNIAAAAVTLSALFLKGLVLFVLNLALSISLCCIQCCKCSKSPV